MLRKRCAAALSAALLSWSFFSAGALAVEGKEQKTIDLAPNARAAVLIDAATGTVLYEKNSREKLPPASITKIMTMLLVMEAIDRGELKWDDKVVASEHAASMGGSQIFLEVGEEMTVADLMKGVAMASGNDASVALAEKIAGSEQLFVEMMNEKAKELGMEDTHFVNSNGLPAPDHVTSARDIAIMSRELLKYEKITEFTGKYEDYLRKDTKKPFWLVNTNKLVRFYSGADGLKTGFTSEAKFCLSATAKRDGMRVIAVVLGEPDTKTRNAEVSRLFDYAFSQYKQVPIIKQGDTLGIVKVEKGLQRELPIKADKPYTVLMKKSQKPESIQHEVILNAVKAPVKKGQPIGKIVIRSDGGVIDEIEILAPETIEKAGWWRLFKRTLGHTFFNGA
jgi:D-alanyl-D-alanine carboxypeptidase (penicillin-binding protein 5/6)